MRHVFLAGHGSEGADGWRLSIPPLEKGICEKIIKNVLT